MEIYLARHGQNEDNANGILNGHRNLPLTTLGRRQGHELALGIKNAGLSFDAVYSSPLARAFETAQIVTCRLELPEPVEHAGLIERDFGILTGRPIADIEKVCGDRVIKTDTITYFLDPPGAETFPELLVRAKQTLTEIQSWHTAGDRLLLVTHGDIGKMLYAVYYGMNWEDCLRQFHFGNSELILLSEKSDASESHVVRIPQYNH